MLETLAALIFQRLAHSSWHWWTWCQRLPIYRESSWDPGFQAWSSPLILSHNSTNSSRQRCTGACQTVVDWWHPSLLLWSYCICSDCSEGQMSCGRFSSALRSSAKPSPWLCRSLAPCSSSMLSHLQLIFHVVCSETSHLRERFAPSLCWCLERVEFYPTWTSSLACSDYLQQSFFCSVFTFQLTLAGCGFSSWVPNCCLTRRGWNSFPSLIYNWAHLLDFIDRPFTSISLLENRYFDDIYTSSLTCRLGPAFWRRHCPSVARTYWDFWSFQALFASKDSTIHAVLCAFWKPICSLKS